MLLSIFFPIHYWAVLLLLSFVIYTYILEGVISFFLTSKKLQIQIKHWILNEWLKFLLAHIT